MKAVVPVRAPFRLDLTVAALFRVATNVVDVVTPDGRYLRALSGGRSANVLDVRQTGSAGIEVCVSGERPERYLETVSKMLGVDTDLTAWYERTRAIGWLNDLTERFRGVKPPRYPSLWEALCHGIVFQQLSIHAGAAIMRRLVEALSPPVEYRGRTLFPFFDPAAVLDASPAALQALGLSRNKAAYIRSAAEIVTAGGMTAAGIERLDTPAAARELATMRGFGPWSAAVVLLRGFGRLDTFPLGDSGVARGLSALSGDEPIDLDAVLSQLGDVRGMLYFHLLLARTQPNGRTVQPEALR